MSKKTTTIAFDAVADQELEHLAHDLQTTKANVIRNSLSLYSFLKQELGLGRDLAIVENDQVHTKIAVPGLTARRPSATRPTEHRPEAPSRSNA